MFASPFPLLKIKGMEGPATTRQIKDMGVIETLLSQSALKIVQAGGINRKDFVERCSVGVDEKDSFHHV
jgi:hypothetical protein